MQTTHYDINNLAPVLITVYDRAAHLENAINSLKLNSIAKYTCVYIVSDNYYRDEDKAKIATVRKYLDNLQKNHKFKELNILAWEENKGSHKSYTDAINLVFEKYDRAIIFEDDILVSNTFLDYMNNALEFYKDDKRIFSIASYLYDNKLIPKDYQHEVFLYGFYQPWGVGMWRDRSNLLDYSCPGIEEFFNNKEELKRFNSISPHAIHILRDMIEKNKIYGDACCCYHMFKHNLYTLYPVKTLSVNKGFDGSGEHCFNDDAIQNKELTLNYYPQFVKNIEPSAEIQANIAKYFSNFKYDKLVPFLKKIKVYTILRMTYRLLKGKNPNFKTDLRARA